MACPRRESEDGFTLIELLVGLSISSLIFGVMAASMILGFKTTGSSEERLKSSHDAQLLSSYLPRDVQSASADPGGVDTSGAAPWKCLAPPPGGSNILQLRSADAANTFTSFWLASNELTRY